MDSQLGTDISLGALAPFVLMLAAIALLPLLARRWFHRDRNKAIVAFILGVPTVLYLVIGFGQHGLDAVVDTAEEYVGFMILLLALYTISGGIHLSGNLIATPRTNLAFLAIGAVLASLVGTMGASMVLIRPVLRTNSERRHVRHTVIFFIFAVSNLGGMLTPLGDPPLFLGFLKGVPFFWTLRLWPQWLLSLALLLAIYMVLEVRHYRREPSQARYLDLKDLEPVRLRGWVNVLLLALVTVTVVLSDPLFVLGERMHFAFVREVILVVLTLASLLLAPKGPRRCNEFQWAPMIEVAIVFAGIFATMIPALELLRAHGGSVGLNSPWHFFWTTGWLSAFLDNAPTYLAFTSIAQGQTGAASLGDLAAMTDTSGAISGASILAAISAGAVMFGALTYIGNAPNFMVRCIAERSGVPMPSFFGFMRYSLVVLLPVFAILTVAFFL